MMKKFITLLFLFSVVSGPGLVIAAPSPVPTLQIHAPILIEAPVAAPAKVLKPVVKKKGVKKKKVVRQGAPGRGSQIKSGKVVYYIIEAA